MDWPYPEKVTKPKLLASGIFHAIPDSKLFAITCPSCNTLNRLAGKYCRKCHTDLNSFEISAKLNLKAIEEESDPLAPALSQRHQTRHELLKVKNLTCCHVHHHYLLIGSEDGKIYVFNLLSPDSPQIIISLPTREIVQSIISITGCDILIACQKSLYQVYAANGDFAFKPITISKVYSLEDNMNFRISPAIIRNDFYYLAISKDLRGKVAFVKVPHEVGNPTVKTQLIQLKDLPCCAISPPCAVGKKTIVFTSNPIKNDEDGPPLNPLAHFYSTTDGTVKSLSSPSYFKHDDAPLFSKEFKTIFMYGRNAPLSSNYPYGLISEGQTDRLISYHISVHPQSGYVLLTHEDGLDILTPDLTRIWDSSSKITRGQDASLVPAVCVGHKIVFAQSNRQQYKTNWILISGQPWTGEIKTSSVIFKGMPVQAPLMAFGHWVFLMRDLDEKISIYILKPLFMER